MKKIIEQFKTYYTKSIESTREVPSPRHREVELHPSSFPFCGLRHIYNRAMDGVSEVFEEPFSMHYYTTIGTVFHEIMQRFLGMHKKIYGDWHCTASTGKGKNKVVCKGKREFSSNHKCPICKAPMQYDELGVRFGDYLIGHVDGLWFNGEEWFVIDYKTTSTKSIDKHYENIKKGYKPSFPYAYNKSQIESYVVLLQKKYKITISGWMLLYISRDSFNNYVFVGSRVSLTEKKEIWANTIVKCDRHFGIAIRAESYKDIIPLIKEKPCKSEVHYKNTMHDHFSPCPLSENGACFNPDVLKRKMIKVIKESEHLPILRDTDKPLPKE